MTNPGKPFWNPYLAGIALGLVLLAAYVTMGFGLGASNASYRLAVAAVGAAAPGHVQSVPALAATVGTRGALDHWIVFEVLGVALGGALGAWSAGRLRREVARGATFGTGRRLALAVGGGVLVGFAARLARGCTSGQGLSGGALLSVGAWAFLVAVFAGGYGTAWLVRRQWR